MKYDTGVLDRALFHAREHLHHLESLPASPACTVTQMRSQLNKPLAQEGLPAAQVIEELVRDSMGGIVNCVGGRFHAWVIGGTLPAALAADWLTSAWDQNAGIYASGPAAAMTEEVAGAWLKGLLNIPASASFAFVTGCQMAHVTCLASARHRVLANRGWNVEEQGLSGAPRIRLIAGSERHGSILRAVRLVGLGKNNIVEIPVEKSGSMPPHALAAELARDPDSPTIVLLQAGDVNTGSYDSFADLIPIARQHGAWTHIDGAFGLWAAASPRLRHLMNGGELADSWATDGHKWLNVPQDSGYAFVSDSAAHLGAMSHRESYLIHDGDARDQMDWNPEWSRRARGFTTYAALRQLGRSGVAHLVERCCDLARRLVMGIGRLPGAEVVAEPVINQGLVRFPGRDTDQVIARINQSGEAFFGATTWRGLRCMRVSVSNWITSEADADRVIEAVKAALSEVR